MAFLGSLVSFSFPLKAKVLPAGLWEEPCMLLGCPFKLLTAHASLACYRAAPFDAARKGELAVPGLVSLACPAISGVAIGVLKSSFATLQLLVNQVSRLSNCLLEPRLDGCGVSSCPLQNGLCLT